MERSKRWLATGSILAALAFGAAVPAMAQEAEDADTGTTTEVQEDTTTEDRPGRPDCDREGAGGGGTTSEDSTSEVEPTTL